MAVDPGRGYWEIDQRKRKTISTDHFSPLPGLASSVTSCASMILRCAVSWPQGSRDTSVVRNLMNEVAFNIPQYRRNWVASLAFLFSQHPPYELEEETATHLNDLYASHVHRIFARWH